MSYAFLIVVSVAITVKLIFLSFSLYYTVKSSETQEKKVADRSGSDHNKQNAKSLLISWKQLPRMFLPRSLYCPEVNDKNYINK